MASELRTTDHGLRTVEVVPAAIPDTFVELESKAAIVSGFANRFHLDVNDGVFVPAVSWPCGEGQWEELEAAAKNKRLPQLEILLYEVHLMVADPGRMGELFARAGASCVVAHIEAFEDAEAARHALLAWRAAGAREAGITMLLDTPLSKIEPLVPDIDVLQIMSIAQVGFQKQSFQERAIERIRELHAAYPKLRIAVDGGVSRANAVALTEAGAMRLVVGSAIMGASDSAVAYQELLGMLSPATR